MVPVAFAPAVIALQDKESKIEGGEALAPAPSLQTGRTAGLHDSVY